MSLKTVKLPTSYNYIACFLTLECNLKCNYCINHFRQKKWPKRKLITGKEWVVALNRLECSSDLPVTLQGGEPSLHPDFIWVIKNIKESLHIDILTNLNFDVDVFIDNINPLRLKRNAPYASIRASYHPGYMDLDKLIDKTLKLMAAGFSVGIFSVLYPPLIDKVQQAKEKCQKAGIDFRTKEFLGEYNKKTCGTYRYPKAVDSAKLRHCFCKTTELIIGSDGNIYRCHHDFYNNLLPVGNLLDPNFEIKDDFSECSNFGVCNPCDIKIKTNRFQVYGHSSVEIKDIK
jgi:sulfatase maturation enzyme AslB (radical SAM superfamily)